MMKRFFLYTLLILVTVGLSALARPQATRSAPTHTVYLPQLVVQLQTAEQQALAEAVVAMVNQERSAAGCAPVTINSQLIEAAQHHSEDMANNNYFGHTSISGARVGDRVSATGYERSSIAENIAAGYRSPESVMQDWMLSGGHRRNILNCTYQHIGVGVAMNPGSTYYIYWTQVFASPR